MTTKFTAAQIAAALGASRQGVQRALANVHEDGREMVRGNEALLWRFSSLPLDMQRKLDRRASASGHRNAEHLLRAGGQRFESSIPISQLSAAVSQRAIKLREALATALARHREGMKGAELEDIGLRDYARVFGYEISARHLRDLLKRTEARDAGEGQWNRLDLYIDERRHVEQPSAPKTSPTKIAAEKILLSYSSQVRDPSQLSAEEKTLLWQIAFEQMEALERQGEKLNAARRFIRRALFKCGAALAKNQASLRELFRVKEYAWRAGGKKINALKDRRSDAAGRPPPEISQSDRNILIGHAVKFGGRLSQAWRHVLSERLLSEEMLTRHEGAYYASKSHVPRSIRDAVTAEIRLLRDIHHGPRAAQLGGAFVSRDWSNVSSGDWYCADDWTFNAYALAPDRRALIRVQVLFMIDVRSTMILGFAVIDERNYNAHAIRSLVTRICDEHGLPRRGFYFERGIWKTSRLLKGDSAVATEELTWTESEGGLRDLGLEFVHAKLPRAKPVERVIGAVQNLMDGMAGDAGRDEVHDKFERLHKRKLLVESGKEPADKFFYTTQQIDELLARFCEEYNNDRNDGKMTGGLTPSQAWRAYQSAPLVVLPPEARYLLASHKRPVVVGRNGITLRFGKQSFIYRNEETGRLRGKKVLAWFNPELPDVLSVTDINRENVFTVPRAEDLPAMDATREQIAREMELVEAHNGYARTRYRTISRAAGLNSRPVLMDAETAQLGSAIARGEQEVREQKQEKKRRRHAARSAMNDLGLAVRDADNFTPERAEAVRAVQAEREKFYKEEAHE
jgi:hypothetical protein